MYYNLENTAGYIDSEFSDVENVVAPGKYASSPRFGRDDGYINRHGLVGGWTPVNTARDQPFTGNKNEFKWWCDEQNVEYSTVHRTSDVTPLSTKFVEKDDVYTVQTTDRTTGDSDDGDNWHSIIIPNTEVEELRDQLLYRLGIKRDLRKKCNNTPNDKDNFYLNKATDVVDVGVNTKETGFTLRVKELENEWLRNMNWNLKEKLLMIMDGYCNLEHGSTSEFINSIQKHLIKVHEHLNYLTANDSTDLHTLKQENYTLRLELEKLKKVGANNGDVDYYKENRVLAERLRTLQESKSALEDDFKKTITYMRLMKDRLKSFKNVKSQGEVKRANTANAGNLKSALKSNVKFAEESDMYLLPKRSLSECKQVLVKPKDKSKLSQLLDFMNVDKIRQVFSGSSEEDLNKREFALYKAHLITKGV